MNESDYAALDYYRNDLAGRVAARDAWRERHPDYDSQEFRIDSNLDAIGQPYEGRSSYDPQDPEPETSDVLSVDTFLRILNVALAAYEKAYGVEP